MEGRIKLQLKGVSKYGPGMPLNFTILFVQIFLPDQYSYVKHIYAPS